MPWGNYRVGDPLPPKAATKQTEGRKLGSYRSAVGELSWVELSNSCPANCAMQPTFNQIIVPRKPRPSTFLDHTTFTRLRRANRIPKVVRHNPHLAACAMHPTSRRLCGVTQVQMRVRCNPPQATCVPQPLLTCFSGGADVQALVLRNSESGTEPVIRKSKLCAV